MFLKFWLPLLWVSASSLSASQAHELPLVDLGYQVHQASRSNSTSEIYSFKNIRYAEPPVGELRFTAPQSPAGRAMGIQNGSVDAICPQASPASGPIAFAFAAAYLSGQPFNFNETAAAIANSNATASFSEPRGTEDCLFLDVYAPKSIFEANSRSYEQGGRKPRAPVLIWIHGGGYIAGHKAEIYDPRGLIEASQVNSSEGLIFVSINYRLGAFGWSSGSMLRANGTANVGLYDQRLAIDWVREKISLFGGDPERVTLMGESAGGGSIIHHITAFGGADPPPPFQQAIVQSPGWERFTSDSFQDTLFQDFLDRIGVETIEESRQKPSSDLIQANMAQVREDAGYSSNLYGPVVDGVLVPDTPGRLLSRGAFYHDVRVMAAHNSNEGILYADPRVTDDASLEKYIGRVFEALPESNRDYIISDLYPAVYDGSQPYRSGLERTVLIVSESTFTCATFHLATAFDNQTYNYLFSVPPGLHALDLGYTFYTGLEVEPVFGTTINETVAVALQQYLTSFAQNGEPKANQLPDFPLYGSAATELNINISVIDTIRDSTANQRCRYWQNAPYF